MPRFCSHTFLIQPRGGSILSTMGPSILIRHQENSPNTFPQVNLIEGVPHLKYSVPKYVHICIKLTRTVKNSYRFYKSVYKLPLILVQIRHLNLLGTIYKAMKTTYCRSILSQIIWLCEWYIWMIIKVYKENFNNIHRCQSSLWYFHYF